MAHLGDVDGRDVPIRNVDFKMKYDIKFELHMKVHLKMKTIFVFEFFKIKKYIFYIFIKAKTKHDWHT